MDSRSPRELEAPTQGQMGVSSAGPGAVWMGQAGAACLAACAPGSWSPTALTVHGGVDTSWPRKGRMCLGDGEGPRPSAGQFPLPLTSALSPSLEGRNQAPLLAGQALAHNDGGAHSSLGRLGGQGFVLP